jgi:hypothetical protein
MPRVLKVSSGAPSEGDELAFEMEMVLARSRQIAEELIRRGCRKPVEIAKRPSRRVNATLAGRPGLMSDRTSLTLGDLLALVQRALVVPSGERVGEDPRDQRRSTRLPALRALSFTVQDAL